jgi:hypothetical protein
MASALVTNGNSTVSSTADFYAWGIYSDAQNVPYFDIRAVGVQANLIPAAMSPTGVNDDLLVFAVNTHQRFSSLDADEIDILINTTTTANPNFQLSAFDEGALTGSPDGTLTTVLFDLTTGAGTIIGAPVAPTDGSTVLLPTFASLMSLTSSAARFTYTARTFDPLTGNPVTVPGNGSFNAFSPSIATGTVGPFDPNTQTMVTGLAIDPVEWMQTPALGYMIVYIDNHAGVRQAQLIPAPL